MQQQTRLFIVDAFTTGRAFSGNPAAVCLLDARVAPEWMQQVAGEMNLSETAFVIPLGDRFGLRWFTPAVEVDLCGHATLATAHVLWQQNRAERSQTLNFETHSGLLTCRSETGGSIAMDFPAEPPAACDPPEGLAAALRTDPVWVGRNRFDLIVELGSARAVRQLSPDFSRLAAIRCRGTIVTAPSDDSEYDFVSRFFAPAVGVDEDPVCGSAHCCLGPFWSARLNKPRLRGLQVSTRQGDIGVEVVGDRVVLRGRAATTLEGNLISPHPPFLTAIDPHE
ncbi:MAG: PhzF family phenazine biosynthesis protein [Planctomycetaceae bacterium]|nr:PhzF family phenazine biosynthesis protein [Planctomycetaceae bacterium]